MTVCVCVCVTACVCVCVTVCVAIPREPEARLCPDPITLGALLVYIFTKAAGKGGGQVYPSPPPRPVLFCLRAAAQLLVRSSNPKSRTLRLLLTLLITLVPEPLPHSGLRLSQTLLITSMVLTFAQKEGRKKKQPQALTFAPTVCVFV